MVNVTLFLNDHDQSKFDMGFSTTEITAMAKEYFGHLPEDGYLSKESNYIQIDTPQFAQQDLQDLGVLAAYVLAFSPADGAFNFPGGGSSGLFPTDKVGAIRWSSHYGEWSIQIDGFSLTFDEMAALAKKDQLIATFFKGADIFYLDVGDDVVDCFGGNDVLTDWGGSNTVHGGAGNDTLSMNEVFGSKVFGRNFVYGDAGKDILTGASGKDDLDGAAGNDTIDGAVGNDRLNGGAGKDGLKGGLGNDSLNGGTGTDTLSGGAGVDKLTGGAGADAFLFQYYDLVDSLDKTDIITDFSGKAGDTINVSAVDANDDKPDNQAFKFIGEKEFHEKAGELRFEIKGAHTFIYTDTDGNGKADQFIELDDAVMLTKHDFAL